MADLEGAIRVLLVDDDAAARTRLGDLLAERGYAVVGAVDGGRDAVERVCVVAPDAVVLGSGGPQPAGVDAMRELAAALPQAAVLLLVDGEAPPLREDDVVHPHALTVLPHGTPPAVLDSALRLAVMRTRAMADAARETRAARDALEARKTIERAKGVLMRRTGSSEQEAYRILQRSSQDRSVPMVEIARAVLASEPGSAAPH